MDRSPEKCTARTARGRCKRWPTRGATVCATHGGSAPQVRAAAAERVLDDQVRELLAQLGTPKGAPVDNPLDALARLAGQILSFKDAVGELVNELREIRYTDSKGSEQLRSEVALYERAMDRAITVLAAMARLKIDERLVAISELQAEMLFRAVNAGFASAGVNEPEVLTEARRVVARELRVLAQRQRGDEDA